jgi:uncharacterized membrane protein (UPF0182 family)
MKELVEKLSAIREDLLAFQALVTDGKIGVEQGNVVLVQSNPHVHKLADLVRQKYPVMQRSYDDLRPYMNNDQKSRAELAFSLNGTADFYFQTGKDHLTGAVIRFVPRMLADLDDIAKKLENNAAPAPKS